jgi:hypothetical protein
MANKQTERPVWWPPSKSAAPWMKKMLKNSGTAFTHRVCQYVHHLNSGYAKERWVVEQSGLRFVMVRDRQGTTVLLVFDPNQAVFSKVNVEMAGGVASKILQGVEKSFCCEHTDDLAVIQLA